MNTSRRELHTGKIALLGSGETTRVGRQILAKLLQDLPEPRTVAVLDTPAGFQPNHLQVAEKIVRFLQEKLAEFHPHPQIIETSSNPLTIPGDAPVLHNLARAQCVIAGPGSPSYMIRKLKKTLYLDVIRQVHAQGGAIYVSSAASIAFSTLSIPVYEIFKVGEDPYWLEGLDFFGPWGMQLAIVPHWNNSEGGAELDTRFCYMGQARFANLRSKLPPGMVILGIDEHTACLIDRVHGQVSVEGKGGTHIVRDGHLMEFSSGETFPLDLLGSHHLPLVEQGTALSVSPTSVSDVLPAPPIMLDPAIEEEGLGTTIPSQLIERLLAIRTELRGAKQWTIADQLRAALAEFGIVVEDTSVGTRWHFLEEDV
jgi:cyanophycinase-like exopeptidase